LNEGNRVVRIKPRYNPDVNQWWICDEGRYGLGWIDRARLRQVRGPSGDASWEQALTAIAGALSGQASSPANQPAGKRIGIITSAQLTSEELFLIREIFQGALGAHVTASVPEQAGYSDEFLIKADKNPNTFGATLLGLAGPHATGAEQIIDQALAGNLDFLWVMRHDLVKAFGEEKASMLSEIVPLLVFSGTNENASVALADWVLPTAAYVEKDGTFVNCHGRAQHFGRAFPPLHDSREDSCILLDLAGRLGIPLDWQKGLVLGPPSPVAP
jgi:NADH-quinone oxidoreductase subunit G